MEQILATNARHTAHYCRYQPVPTNLWVQQEQVTVSLHKKQHAHGAPANDRRPRLHALRAGGEETQLPQMWRCTLKDVPPELYLAKVLQCPCWHMPAPARRRRTTAQGVRDMPFWPPPRCSISHPPPPKPGGSRGESSRSVRKAWGARSFGRTMALKSRRWTSIGAAGVH